MRHFDERQIGLFSVFVTTLIKRQIHSSKGCSLKSSNKVFWAFTVPFYVFLSSFLSESDSTLFCRHSGSKCSTKTVFREQGCSNSPLLKSQCFDRFFSVSSQNWYFCLIFSFKVPMSFIYIMCKKSHLISRFKSFQTLLALVGMETKCEMPSSLYGDLFFFFFCIWKANISRMHHFCGTTCRLFCLAKS